VHSAVLEGMKERDRQLGDGRPPDLDLTPEQEVGACWGGGGGGREGEVGGGGTWRVAVVGCRSRW
jgi:hypothetical protein